MLHVSRLFLHFVFEILQSYSNQNSMMQEIEYRSIDQKRKARSKFILSGQFFSTKMPERNRIGR